jgi:hypothetical protein
MPFGAVPGCLSKMPDYSISSLYEGPVPLVHWEFLTVITGVWTAPFPFLLECRNLAIRVLSFVIHLWVIRLLETAELAVTEEANHHIPISAGWRKNKPTQCHLAWSQAAFQNAQATPSVRCMKDLYHSFTFTSLAIESRFFISRFAFTAELIIQVVYPL